MSKREENRKRWSELVQRFYQSNLSAYRFAKEEGISLTSLQYWKKRIPRQEALEFLPIRSVSPNSSLGPVTLEIPGGALLHFSQQTSPETLAQFVAALSVLGVKQ